MLVRYSDSEFVGKVVLFAIVCRCGWVMSCSFSSPLFSRSLLFSLSPSLFPFSWFQRYIWPCWGGGGIPAT